MLKVLWKLLVVFAGVFLALLGFSYWSRNREPKYITIYTSDQPADLY